MLEIFPLVHPALVGEVRIQHPLEAPDALRAAISHLCATEEIPAAQLRLFSSDGNGPVAPIMSFLSAVGAVPSRGAVNFGAVYPACRFDADGVTVFLDGLDQTLAQRAIFHVLPVARQRDLSCAFTVIDHKHDNVLDFEELEGVLMHHERELIKLSGGKGSPTGSTVRGGRLADIELLERAKRVFAAADKLRLGLIGLEDFLAVFARGTFHYDLIESVIAVNNSSPHRSRSALGGDDDVESGEGVKRATSTEPHRPARGGPRPSAATQEINQDLENEFAKYDRNKSGYLSRAEFGEAYLKLEHFGLVPSKSEIDKLFGSICVDKEKMSFDEFCVIMLRRSRM
jgi:hypothetical protein